MYTLDQLANSLQLAECQFIKGHNAWLDVNNRNVLDIGANIGDTAIYFALKNAKHVFAIEPYPYSCKIAKKNVKLNKLKSKITVIDAAVGSKSTAILISNNYKNSNDDIILKKHQLLKKKTATNKIIPMYTLDQLANKLNINNAALKMDCEGCEYDIIKSASKNTLERFDRMLIACHNDNVEGISELKERLKNLGFEIIDGLPDNSIGAIKS